MSRVSYRNYHNGTVKSVISTIKNVASVNGYKVYVNDDDKMENIIDFMFQRGDNGSVFRIEIHLDEVKDWEDTYEVISHRLKSNNYDRGFDCFDINEDSLYGKSAYQKPTDTVGEFHEWIKNNPDFTKQLLGIPTSPYKKPHKNPSIEKVIFNDPATIVYWSDGDKTVMKVHENDIFDPEKGLAMAICKKLLGSDDGSYYNVFKKWLPEEEVKLSKDGIAGARFSVPVMPKIEINWDSVHKDIDDLKKSLNEKFGILKSDDEKKGCINCKYRSVKGNEEPCRICNYVRIVMNESYTQWKPREEEKEEPEKNGCIFGILKSDDEKNGCINCKYLDTEPTDAPCFHCTHNTPPLAVVLADNWTPKEKEETPEEEQKCLNCRWSSDSAGGYYCRDCEKIHDCKSVSDDKVYFNHWTPKEDK